MSDRAGWYAGLERLDVMPLWTELRDLFRNEPASDAVPHIWPYADIRAELARAGEILSIEEAERRVLMLVNPGVAERRGTTSTLYAGLQYILPGETARAHRHMAAAFRFVIEGRGASTTVDGQCVPMEPRDLLLTPAWSWHDHTSAGDGPIVWLDGLDFPLVNLLETGFFELYPERQQAPGPADACSGLRYPWAPVEAALRAAAGTGSVSAADGVVYDYTHPRTAAPVLPTMACRAQWLRPGTHTAAHRHTASSVYHVVRGHGTTIVDGVALDWSTHDTFAVPGWAVHEHVNGAADEEAVLFVYTDEPVLTALGLFREEA